MSLVRLSDVFGVNKVFDGGDQTYVVIIGVAEAKLGIIVDTLVGQEEIVIKSMGDYCKISQVSLVLPLEAMAA